MFVGFFMINRQTLIFKCDLLVKDRNKYFLNAKSLSPTFVYGYGDWCIINNFLLEDNSKILWIPNIEIY